MDEQDIISIASTSDPLTGAPQCLLEWGTITKALSVQETLLTARGLMAAAIAAETDKALMEELTDSRGGLGLDFQTAGQILLGVRERRGTIARPSGRAALRIEAVYGARMKLPRVYVGRGWMKTDMSPDEARQMGQHWVETAVAASVDVRVRYAMGEGGLDIVAIDDIFKAAQELQR